MLVILYCRVLFIIHRVLLLNLFTVAFHQQTKFVELFVELIFYIIWIQNKLHHHSIVQLTVLSLLSTTVGPEHEPPLLRGVVSLQQTKSCSNLDMKSKYTE